MSIDFAQLARVDAAASALIDAVAQQRIEESLDRAQARVAHACDEIGGEEGLAAMARWLSVRRLWDSVPEPLRRNVRTHPAFRYFVHGVHRANAPLALLSAAAAFPQVAWAAALQHGRRWRGDAALDYRGGLRAPGYARFIEFGEHRALQRVQLSLEKDRAVFEFPDQLVVQVVKDDACGWPDDHPDSVEHGYDVRYFPRLGRIRAPVETRDPWLRARLTGTNQRTDGVAFDDCDDERYEDRPPLRHIEEALGLIDAVWPEEMDDIALFVRAIVAFKAAPGAHAAFTVSSRQGAVFIGEAPVLATAEAIAHEAAHVKLRQIQLLDPLLADPLAENLRVRVPWRNDPRPVPGVFEGVFVFTHVAELMRRLAGEGDPSAARRHQEIKRDLHAGVALVSEHAKLTAAGAPFFDALRCWAAEA